MNKDNCELLKLNLQAFLAVTENLITAIKKEQDGLIDELFIKRQCIINEVQKLQYSKEEFSALANSLNLIEISKELDDLINTKREEMKRELNQLKDRKDANRSYTSNSVVKKAFFSTKV